MAVYTRLMRYGIHKPAPAHALTPGAEEARQSLRRLGHENRLRRRLSAVVTQHGTPKPPHYVVPEKVKVMQYRVTKKGNRKPVGERLVETGRMVPGPHVVPAARGVASLATASGFEVRTRETATGCVVEGLHASRRVGFRAYWSQGVSRGATWHSGGRDHWSLVDITDRPIGVDANAKTTKAKHRHGEQDRTRLVLVASPRGVHINVTELRKRIKG